MEVEVNINKFLDQYTIKKQPLRNTSSPYEDLSDKFRVYDLNYEVQYSHLYFIRLEMLKPIVLQRLTRDGKKVLGDLSQMKTREQCIVIGTLYKEMKLKPNIFQKLESVETHENIQRDSYVSEDDIVILEDNTGRVKLSFKNTSIKHQHLITGIVAAIEGTPLEGGTLEVKNIYYPQQPYIEQRQSVSGLDPITKYLTQGTLHKDDEFIVFVSGLELNEKSDQTHQAKWLTDFICGDFIRGKFLNITPKISRIIFAGNNISQQKESIELQSGFARMQDVFSKIQENTTKSINHLDTILYSISNSIQVDIMPGETDPTDTFIPQQKLNKAFFPQAYHHQTFSAQTNPYKFKLGNNILLGTSGQNIQNIQQFSNISESEIDICEKCLEWKHIAPSAPDTLKVHPFTNEDPFILDELPQVYFVGNCSKYATKLVAEPNSGKVCRIICLPKYKDTQSIVLLNIRNLECFEFSLKPIFIE